MSRAAQSLKILGSATALTLALAIGSPGATPKAQAAGEWGRVIVQAHRGGPALGAPENSLELFQRARDARVDLVEMDVVFTKDKVAIVNHDDKIKDVSSYVVNGVTVPKLDRTHEGKKIHDMTAVQVAEVRCGSHPLPTLAEVIQIFKGSGIPLNVEIKSWDESKQSRASRQEYASLAVKELLDGGMRGKFVISSFVWRDILPTVRKIDTSIPVIGFDRIDDPDGSGPTGFVRQPKSSQ